MPDAITLPAPSADLKLAMNAAMQAAQATLREMIAATQRFGKAAPARAAIAKASS